MPQGNKKSRTFRRVKVKTPGGKVKIHYKRRKPSAARCAVDGTKLHGVPRVVSRRLKGLSKSQKRPERPFGGILSSRSMRERLKERARALFKLSK